MTGLTPTIRQESSGGDRRYIAALEGMASEAVLALSMAGPDLLIAAHTSVPDEMAGMCVGRALVERLVHDARGRGFEIIALCPFVKSQILRHAEWKDAVRG